MTEEAIPLIENKGKRGLDRATLEDSPNFAISLPKGGLPTPLHPMVYAKGFTENLLSRKDPIKYGRQIGMFNPGLKEIFAGMLFWRGIYLKKDLRTKGEKGLLSQ